MYKLWTAIKFRFWYEITKLMQKLWFKCVTKRDEYKMIWYRMTVFKENRDD